MAQIHIDDNTVIVTIEGLNKLWALKSSLTIPLTNIRGATIDPGIVNERKGFRAPGTNFPGLITAGTFHLNGERIFWDVHNPHKTIVIELTNEHYARLIIEVDNPRAAVELIETAIQHKK